MTTETIDAGSPLKTVTVALAGAPNTGKSTIFNALTGLRRHVGNWPGKTVEKKTGICRRAGRVLSFVDLPGSYSLSANSPEEEIAREFLARERPDVVVATVDASSLERNLYLVCELLQLDVPLVVALNMMDVAQSGGLRIDTGALQSALGVPVVPMVAREGLGVSQLLDALDAVADGTGRAQAVEPPMNPDIEQLVDELDAALPAEPDSPYPRRWALVKLLEGDPLIRKVMSRAVTPDSWRLAKDALGRHEAAMLEIAGSRYDWAAETWRKAVSRSGKERISFEERADRVLTHPFGGLIVFAALLFVVYWLVFEIGIPAQRWLNANLVERSSHAVESALAGWPAWISGLVTQGVIGGAGTVVTFAPILVILFFAMAVLEDVGYMARGALVMDRFMHGIGLRGKSFLPLFTGWGCNVPAIIGSRIVESESTRLTTILVTPFMPCTARMAVIALFAAAFFGSGAPFVAWGLIMVNLAMMALTALFINRVVFRGQESSFVLELPPYHIPSLRIVLLATWDKVSRFVKLAGTIIIVISIVVWALSSFPGNEIGESVLGHIGRGLEPIGGLMGLDWRMMVGLLSSFVAKEQTIATLGVILGTGQGEALKTSVTGMLTPAAAVSFMVLQMLFIPCASSVATIWQETRSWRWTGFVVGYMLVIAFSVAIVVYQVARLTGLGM
jgi:ferrous iron transport protein B